MAWILRALLLCALLAVLLLLVASVGGATGTASTNKVSSQNICARNATIGRAVLRAVNLTKPGLEMAQAAAGRGDRGAACAAIAAYFRQGNSTAWLRIPHPVAKGSGRVGGAVDAMVFNDTFAGFPSPSYPVTIPRGADGGLDWTWYGPDQDDEFMNVLNRHGYFGSLLSAWNTTGNDVYPTYFDALVRDWVTHLPCNNANFSTHPGATFCAPLGAKNSGDPWAAAQRTCQ